MVRIAANVVALALVVLIMWLLWPWKDGGEAARPGAVPVKVRAERSDVLAEAEGGSEEAAVDEVGDRTALEAPEASVATEEPGPEPVPVRPAGERAWLELLVVNGRAEPVPRARVAMDGLRLRDAPGGHYAWFGEPSTEITDDTGRARLHYPTRIGREGETGFVSFGVSHPDYVPHRSLKFDVSEGGGTVVLELGCVLSVAGWIGQPGNVITDVEPRLDDRARLRPEDWLPRRDGWPTTNKLRPGLHPLFLSHVDREGRHWWSEVVELNLEEGDSVERKLELRPAVTVVGRLDDVVPRPVFEGRLQLNMFVGGEGLPPVSRTFPVAIEPDGSFTIEGVPEGRGEIIALCDGWVSKPRSEDLGGEVEDEQGRLVLDWSTRREAEVEVSGGGGGESGTFELELAMVPSAVFRAVVHDANGRPVEGAQIDFWPNVHWSHGYSEIFLDLEYTATTDVDGWAEVRNLVPGNQSFSVSHADWRLAPEDEERLLALRSGGLLEIGLELVPND